MSGDKVLLDSNVIILASKNEVRIDKVFEKYSQFFISVINYIEVLGYGFEREEEKMLIEKLLENFDVVDVNLQIAKIAIGYRKKKKIKLADAVILATTKFIGADLITYNANDFLEIDKTVKVKEI